METKNTVETKNIVVIECKKGDHIISLHIPVGMSWGSVIDGSYELFMHTVEIHKQQVEQMRPVAEEPVQPEIV